MKLSDKQRKKYLESGGNSCPFCDSENIAGAHIETDSSCAWQNVVCDDCEEEWTDEYTLTGVEAV